MRKLSIYTLSMSDTEIYKVNVMWGEMEFIFLIFLPPLGPAMSLLCRLCSKVKYKMIKLSGKPDILKIKSTSLWWFREIVERRKKSKGKGNAKSIFSVFAPSRFKKAFVIKKKQWNGTWSVYHKILSAQESNITYGKW